MTFIYAVFKKHPPHPKKTITIQHTQKKLNRDEMARVAKERWESAVTQGGGVERLASCSDDFTLFLWEPSVGKKPVQRMTGHMQLVNHIAFSPDGGRYLASASFDKSVKLWDGMTGK
jgi:ribosome assembly protein 4